MLDDGRFDPGGVLFVWLVPSQTIFNSVLSLIYGRSMEPNRISIQPCQCCRVKFFPGGVHIVWLVPSQTKRTGPKQIREVPGKVFDVGSSITVLSLSEQNLHPVTDHQLPILKISFQKFINIDVNNYISISYTVFNG